MGSSRRAALTYQHSQHISLMALQALNNQKPSDKCGRDNLRIIQGMSVSTLQQLCGCRTRNQKGGRIARDVWKYVNRENNITFGASAG